MISLVPLNPQGVGLSLESGTEEGAAILDVNIKFPHLCPTRTLFPLTSWLLGLQSICPRGREATVPPGGCPPASAFLSQGHQRQGGGRGGGLRLPTPAQLPELTAVLVPREQVEHGIQAAVGTGQRPSHFVDHIDNVQHLAVDFQQP